MSALMIWMVVLLLLSVADKSMATGSIRRLVLAAGANNGGVDRDLLRYAVTDAG